MQKVLSAVAVSSGCELQMMKSPLITGFVANIDAEVCRRDPDAAFRDGILTPLMTVPPPSHNLFILVDSVDESYLQVFYYFTS